MIEIYKQYIYVNHELACKISTKNIIDINRVNRNNNMKDNSERQNLATNYLGKHNMTWS